MSTSGAKLFKWQELIGIDLRSLALFRIGMGFTILVSLSTFFPHITLFLSDRGIYPRSLAMWERGSNEAFSLFFISGRPEMMFLLLALTALAALALMLGYYTRIASVVCWVMVSSLNLRAGVFLSGADSQLNLMLFWAMFLPLGARFSIDHALSKEPEPDKMTSSAASLALLLQVGYVYLMGALMKTGAPWVADHTAVANAISNAHLATMFSAYLAQWPELTKFLTLYVYHLELYAVFFLFFPLWNQPIRLAMFVLLATMHFGFYLFLDVSFFPLISTVGLTIFIPTLFWDRLTAWLAQKWQTEGYTIYYDEECEFCKKTCLIFRELSIFPETPVEPAQAHPDIYAILQRENSWVVKTVQEKILLHWDAVAYVWRRSPLLWPLGILFLPGFMRPLGRHLYRFIAERRGEFGRFSATFLPYRKHVAIRPSMANTVVIVPLILLTLLINIRVIPEYKTLPMPRLASDIIAYAKLGQHWLMFAPYPSPATTWAVVEGFSDDGKVVDLLWETGKPPSYEVPSLGIEAYPSRRWHKFFSYYNWPKAGKTFGTAMCRRWAEEKNPVRLNRVVVTMFKQKNLPGQPRDLWPITQKKVLDFNCWAPRPSPSSRPPAAPRAPK